MASYITREQFIEWTRDAMVAGGLEPLTPEAAEQDYQDWVNGTAQAIVPVPESSRIRV